MPDRLFAVVEAPQQRPPRGATLERSANPITEPDERWVAGLQYLPESCGTADNVQAAGYCGSGFAGFPDDGDDWALGELVQYVPPFVAVASECSAIGGETELALVQARAARLLEACQTKGIAKELWRGDIAKAATPDLPNNYLANSASYTDLGSGSDFSLLDAMAALEEGLAHCSCGGIGMIHATPQAATYWAHLRLIDRQPDGRLLTALGTLVVVDPGYDGSAANGSVDESGASSWAYATSMVDLRLGAVDVLADKTVIKTRNDFIAYTFRPFAATFEPCCHLAAQLDHTRLT